MTCLAKDEGSNAVLFVVYESDRILITYVDYFYGKQIFLKRHCHGVRMLELINRNLEETWPKCRISNFKLSAHK